MQGRCDEGPPPSFTVDFEERLSGPGEPWQAPRCVLVASEPMFVVDHPALWVDSLHIHVVDEEIPDDGAFDYSYRVPTFVFHLSGWALVYVTNTAITDLRDAYETTYGAAALVTVHFCGGGIYMKGVRLEVLHSENRPVSRIDILGIDALPEASGCLVVCLQPSSHEVVHNVCVWRRRMTKSAIMRSSAALFL